MRDQIATQTIPFYFSYWLCRKYENTTLLKQTFWLDEWMARLSRVCSYHSDGTKYYHTCTYKVIIINLKKGENGTAMQNTVLIWLRWWLFPNFNDSFAVCGRFEIDYVVEEGGGNKGFLSVEVC